MLVEISKLSVNIIQETSRMRTYDIPALSGSAARIEEELNWRADITLEQTFTDLLRYWRAKEGVQ
jgi:UDP-glucose 4-epimerase